jgi:hypothetical protein
MSNYSQPNILSVEGSASWRDAYLKTFIDTSSDYYYRHIATPRKFSDGIHYEGYLWACLLSPSRTTIERFRLEVVRHTEVLVMADDHSRDRIPGAPMWPYRPCSVAHFRPETLLQSLDSLPEDIYIFDETVSWTLALTHEHDERRRICFSVGIET